MKKLMIVIGIVVLVAFGWFGRDLLVSAPALIPEDETTVPAEGELPDGEVCIQVITPARNLETGEIQEFPTPCDVPEGWEVIQNDIPAL